MKMIIMIIMMIFIPGYIYKITKSAKKQPSTIEIYSFRFQRFRLQYLNIQHLCPYIYFYIYFDHSQTFKSL